MKKGSKVSIGSVLSIATVLGVLLLSIQSKADFTTFDVDVPLAVYHQGDIFDIQVICNTSSYVKAWECKLNYDPNVLNAIQVTEGNLFLGYPTFFSEGIINNSQGSIINMFNLIIGTGNMTGTGTVINIKFHGIGIGHSNISLSDVGVTNETMYLELVYVNSSVFIYSPYDINCDRIIDLQDLIDVSFHYGETGSPGWIPEDIDNDGKINIIDLVIVALHWGSY